MVPCSVFSVSVYAGNPDVLTWDTSAGAAFPPTNPPNWTTKPPAGETAFGRVSPASALDADAADLCGSGLAPPTLVAVGPAGGATSGGRCAGSTGLLVALSASAGFVSAGVSGATGAGFANVGDVDGPARSGAAFPSAPLPGESGVMNLPLSIGGIWIDTSSPSGFGSLSSNSGRMTAAASASTIAPTSRRRARRLSSSTAGSAGSGRVSMHSWEL